jgi:hypothetical protein
MKANEEILKEIIDWANSSHSYLSETTPYAKGYKDGIRQAKEIIKNIKEE